MDGYMPTLKCFEQSGDLRVQVWCALSFSEPSTLWKLHKGHLVGHRNWPTMGPPHPDNFSVDGGSPSGAQ